MPYCFNFNFITKTRRERRSKRKAARRSKRFDPQVERPPSRAPVQCQWSGGQLQRRGSETNRESIRWHEEKGKKAPQVIPSLPKVRETNKCTVPVHDLRIPTNEWKTSTLQEHDQEGNLNKHSTMKGCATTVEIQVQSTPRCKTHPDILIIVELWVRRKKIGNLRNPHSTLKTKTETR